MWKISLIPNLLIFYVLFITQHFITVFTRSLSSLRSSYPVTYFIENSHSSFQLPSHVPTCANHSHHDCKHLPIAKLDNHVFQSSLKSLSQISRVSLWTQFLLNSLSSLTLLFATSVISLYPYPRGYFIAGLEFTLSIFSLFWNFGLKYAIHNLFSMNAPREQCLHKFKRSMTIFCIINLLRNFSFYDRNGINNCSLSKTDSKFEIRDQV